MFKVIELPGLIDDYGVPTENQPKARFLTKPSLSSDSAMVALHA